MAYPFKSTANSDISSTLLGSNFVFSTISTTVNDWFNIKEIFSDFSIKDRVFFRFGLHTVTWGTGFFFSPVSDIINTSSINPEDTDEQVNGSLNLSDLTRAEGLMLSKTINGYLYLNGLTSLEGLILPNNVKYEINIYNGYYTLEEVKKMQQQELVNKKKAIFKFIKKIKTRKPSSGTVNISFLIVSIFLFCSLTFFVCNMILNK
jgi:hypothetical protein